MGALDNDGYDEVWHAATLPANQKAVAWPCACPTRSWFARFLGFRQQTQVGLYHTARPLSQLTPTLNTTYYKAPTTRTLNIARCQHPRCSFQILLAYTLTRLLSDLFGTLACSPDRRSVKRARTRQRSSVAAVACLLSRQHKPAIIPFSPLPFQSHKTAEELLLSKDA